MNIFKKLLPTIVMLLFEIAVGVLLMINGEKFTQVIFIIFGVLLLVSGLITLIRSLLNGRNGGSIPMSQLLLAIILIAVGAFFTAASGVVLSVMSAVTLVIGVIMAFNGMLKLVEFAAIRRTGQVTWFALVSAIITIILGLVLAFNPFGATEAIWIIMGIMLIVSAVFDVIALILFAIALKKAPPQNVIEAEGRDIEEIKNKK